jgi:hypothetical protein
MARLSEEVFQVAPGKTREGRMRCNDYLRNLSLEPRG